jgi:amidase
VAAGVRGIDAALTQHKLDAIVAPTAGPAWVTDLVNGDHFIGGDASSMPAIAGYPHITVPAGFVHGLPVGLSFISTGLQDQALIEISSSFERISAARKAPAVSP